MLTEAQFRKVFPNCPARKAASYLPLLVAAMLEFGINTRRRAAAFCAQVGHESQDFRYMQEIASGAAYEGRRDLGNVRPGDGRRFKGRGPIQITGRDNYRKAGEALGLPLLDNPHLLELPEYAFRASAWFWSSHDLNQYADKLTGRGDAKDLGRFDRITRVINGGYNHRVERQRRYLVAAKVLTEDGEQAAPAAAQAEAPAPAAPQTAGDDGISIADIPFNSPFASAVVRTPKGLVARLCLWVTTALASGEYLKVGLVALGVLVAVAALAALLHHYWPRLKPALKKVCKGVKEAGV